MENMYFQHRHRKTYEIWWKSRDWTKFTSESERLRTWIQSSSSNKRVPFNSDWNIIVCFHIWNENCVAIYISNNTELRGRCVRLRSFKRVCNIMIIIIRCAVFHSFHNFYYFIHISSPNQLIACVHLWNTLSVHTRAACQYLLTD